MEKAVATETTVMLFCQTYLDITITSTLCLSFLWR